MSDVSDLAITLAEDDPVTAAAILAELPPATIIALLTETSQQQASALLAALPSPVASTCLSLVTAERAASWLQAIGYPLRTVLARGMSAPFRSQVLTALPKSSAMQIKRDIAYVPDSVGAWMEEATAVLSEDETVGDSLARLRRQKHDLEQSLVVTGKGRKYLGLVTLSTLLKAPDKKAVSSIADRSIAPLDPDTPLTEASVREEWKTHFLLPVTGKRNSFLGVLRSARLYTAMEQEIMTTEVPGSHLIGHLMEAALVSAAGMSSLMPSDQAGSDEDTELGT